MELQNNNFKKAIKAQINSSNSHKKGDKNESPTDNISIGMCFTRAVIHFT